MSGKRSEMLVAEMDREFLRHAPGRIPGRLVAQGLFEGRPPMTRGRWLDAVTRNHLRAAARFWPREQVDRPIFIVGVGRSGTTLLGRLLAVHPDVGYLKEPKAIWSLVHPDEDISGFYSDRGRLDLGTQDVTADVSQRARRLFNWYATVSNSDRVVDKYPEMTYRVPFLRAIFPDAIIIAIVRRPSSVIRSIVRFSEQMRDDRGDWWGVDDGKWRAVLDYIDTTGLDGPELAGLHLEWTASPEQRAEIEWRIGAMAIIDNAHLIDDVVRYEELLADPGGTMERVATAASIESAPVVTYANAIVNAPHTVPRADDLGFEELLEGLGYSG